MTDPFDAIVVGARCAGSPTAMLLAQKGYRVLVVDRSTFPSDTVSTHFIHAPGVAALRRWDLLDKIVATGCPPVVTYSFDFGPITISGTPLPADGHSTAYAPRRTVLDTLLVDAASSAGAEVREGFTVDEIVFEDGRVAGIRGRDGSGRTITERARVVIGADGVNSRVAKAVEPEQYHDKPILQAGYYTYFNDLPVNGFEITIRPDRGWAALPTNDGLTLVVLGWPYAEHAANKHDVETNFFKALELSPDFADRVGAATRVDRFHGSPVPNFFRKPYGPGWALVGDAGYTKDPITAQGMSNAFRERGALRSCPRPDVHWCADLRRRHGRLPGRARHAFDPALRVHHAAGDARTAAAGDAAAPRHHPRQPARHGCLRQRHRRDALTHRVLRPRQHRRLDGVTGHEPLKPGSGSV